MYAEVIVDVSASEIDRIFDYACDSDMETGFRVLVPFGKREIEGYVIGVKSDTDFDKSRIKPIISKLDRERVISDNLLSLAVYMCGKYNLKMVDALRLFIPSQMRGGHIKELYRNFISLSETYDESAQAKAKPLSPNMLEVLRYMQEVGRESLAVLSQEYSVSAINNLVARGILVKTSDIVQRRPYKGVSEVYDSVQLTPLQQATIRQITDSDKSVTLLHGITGSGKTEVYISLIKDVLSEGKTAIMLVPEIGLTPQALRIFRAKFGDYVAIIHSGLSAGERFDEWRRLLLGDAKVAIGARSAIFAPLNNIGIIIIDEEHDSSYISESNPRYDTKEVAKFIATQNNCKLVLGSATPSIETYHSTTTGEYALAEMMTRINNRSLPRLEIVDMRLQVYAGNNSILSDKLVEAIASVVGQQNKVMLFLNRRGYSSYVICKSCGYVAKCSDCDVSLVYHKEENVLKCHFCNNRFALLDVCPSCGFGNISRGFVGTEQVVDILKQKFAGVGILRMDNDTTKGKDGHLDILKKFAEDGNSILVGTQMIVKGHDFASVALVGILDADMSLHFSDYRAVERTYQLITQASGRAGRADIEGRVILQTYTPSHYVYKFADNADYKGFFAKEHNLRETAQYPPFSTIIRVLVSGEIESMVQKALKDIFESITSIKKDIGGFVYLACMRSPIKRIQSKYRMQVLARVANDKRDDIIALVYKVANSAKNDKILIFVEINPSNLS